MKYKMYLSTTFIAVLLLPLMGVKANDIQAVEDFDLDTIEFFEVEESIQLGFDSTNYLPEGFDPYTETIAIESIDFIEDEEVELDFDTKAYLPEGFDAYK